MILLSSVNCISHFIPCSVFTLRIKPFSPLVLLGMIILENVKTFVVDIRKNTEDCTALRMIFLLYVIAAIDCEKTPFALL